MGSMSDKIKGKPTKLPARRDRELERPQTITKSR